MTASFKHPIAFALWFCVSGCDNAEIPKPPKTEADDKKPKSLDAGDTAPAAADSGSKPGAGPDPKDTPVVDKPPGIDIPERLVLDTARPSLLFADAATKRTAAELAKQIDGMEFPYALEKVEANALPFLHLAHTSDDPAVATAALVAIEARYSYRDSGGERKADANYHAVVAYRLASEDAAVLTAAFGAAKNSAQMVPPDVMVIAILVDRAHHHESLAGRFAALDVLRGVKVATGEILAAFEHALTDKSPQFVALTLDAMGFMGDKMAMREAFVSTVIEFTEHPEASIRGEAVAVLSRLATLARSPEISERVFKVVLPMLDDPASSVRGEAAYAMGMMRRVETAAKMVELLDDTGSTYITVDGWTNIDGSANRPTLGIGMSKTVASVAVMSLSLFSTTTDAEFKYAKDIVRDGVGEEDYGPAIKKARNWYAANKDKLKTE